MSVVNFKVPTQAQTLDSTLIHLTDLTSRRQLQPRWKAEQLRINNTGAVVSTQAVPPVWAADQIICVYCDGNFEVATFMVDEATFNYYVALPITANPGDAINATFQVLPNMKSIEFVKFAGANLLAGQYA